MWPRLIISARSHSSSTLFIWWVESRIGDPGRASLLEDVLEQLDVDRIEAAERLVEDQQPRLADQRGAELDLLLHALGQRLHLLVAQSASSTRWSSAMPRVARFAAARVP